MKLDDRRKLHAMTTEQLEHELAEAERNLINYRFDIGLKRMSNPAGMHKERKQIARLKTLIHQRKLMAEHGLTTMDEYRAFASAEEKAYRERRKAGSR